MLSFEPVARRAAAIGRTRRAVGLGAGAGHRIGIVILVRITFAASARAAAVNLAGAAVEACTLAAFAVVLVHVPVTKRKRRTFLKSAPKREGRAIPNVRKAAGQMPGGPFTWSAAGGLQPGRKD